MSRESRQAHYLARAKEAEDNAEAAKGDEESRARWLAIAESYRQLAKTT
jgi:hypothetical protein